RMMPDGESFFVMDLSSVRPAIRQWRIDTDDDFLNWVYANRYIRDLTCAERELYRIEPLCEAGAA
ncbi:MAG: hypothetical protein KC615_21685, partial [Anaerolineae bacterium]|nr:hypothetical protein [Anaerolineae bacterium]